MSRHFVFIAAGGSGSRFGGAVPKQYARIGTMTLLEHCLEVFNSLASIEGVYLGLSQTDRVWPGLVQAHPQVAGIAPAGAQRPHTVLSGLEIIARQAPPDSWVLVHDACRPCIRAAAVERLLAARQSHPHGAILATPVVDTLKTSDDGATVVATVGRDRLWQAQTPQMFPLGLLRQCLQSCARQGIEVTDDAMAVEHCGFPVGLVRGDRTNIKITTADDMALAAAILGTTGS